MGGGGEGGGGEVEECCHWLFMNAMDVVDPSVRNPVELFRNVWSVSVK